MHGFKIAEQGHVVSMLSPVDVIAATSSEVINLENWSHVSFICMKGAGSSATIVVEECDDFVPTNVATIPYSYAQEATAAGDTLTALAAAGTAGIASGTASGVLLVIEIDADELSDGFPYIRLKCADPGTSHLGTWVAICSGGRYQEDITATIIV